MKNPHARRLSGLLALFAAGNLWAAGLSPELDRLTTTAAPWNNSASDFMLAYTPLGFGYESQRRDCARSVDRRLTFHGQQVWEAVVYFETGAVKRVELSLYNRGDAGVLDEAAFQQLYTAQANALTRWAGNTGSPLDDAWAMTLCLCVLKPH